MEFPAQYSQVEKLPVILLDDDVWVREAWELAASQMGVPIKTFAGTEVFFAQVRNLDRSTRFFLDVDLEEENDGVEVAKKLILLGYSEIYFSTGHDTVHIEKLEGVKGVIGKDFPDWLV